jgi:hypothetical protein
MRSVVIVPSAIFILVLSIIAIAGIVGIPQALAKKGSAYDAGSEHAVQDCQAGTQKYYNSPGKGPAFHTDEFNQGYQDSWEECHSPAP